MVLSEIIKYYEMKSHSDLEDFLKVFLLMLVVLNSGVLSVISGVIW